MKQSWSFANSWLLKAASPLPVPLKLSSLLAGRNISRSEGNLVPYRLAELLMLKLVLSDCRRFAVDFCSSFTSLTENCGPLAVHGKILQFVQTGCQFYEGLRQLFLTSYAMRTSPTALSSHARFLILDSCRLAIQR